MEHPSHVAAERLRQSSSSRPPRSQWPHRTGAAQVIQGLDGRAEQYGQLSRAIWEAAEVGYKETKSSALLRDELKAAGFRVDEGVAGMPTAFVATWGSGTPVIGIMGEFDALPGLSQETVPEQKARVSGGARARLRPQPAGRRVAGGGAGREGAARVAQAARHHPLLRHAGGRGRQRQGLHGAGRSVQGRRRRAALASQRPQHRRRAPARWPSSPRSSASRASPRTRPARRTRAARRSTR